MSGLVLPFPICEQVTMSVKYFRIPSLSNAFLICCFQLSIPVIAIGGISSKNVTELKGRGIVGIAVISAIFAQPDITKATAELKALTEKTVAND